MDTTLIRQTAQIEAIGFFLGVLVTYPLIRHIHLDLSTIPAWPLFVACILGIGWFSGLFISTGQEDRWILRSVLVPFLAVVLFSGVNFAWLWLVLVIKASVHLGRPARGRHNGGIGAASN